MSGTAGDLIYSLSMKLLRPLLGGLLALAVGSLALAVQAAPTNDNLSLREELPPSGPATLGSNVGATLETNEPIPAGFTTATYGATSWWWLELAASEDVWYDVETTGSSFNTVLAIWTGDDFEEPLSLVHVNDEAAEGATSRIRFLARTSTIYKISVAGRGEGQQGNIALKATGNSPVFARVDSATLSLSSSNVTNAAAAVTATISLRAGGEIASGQFVLYNPNGVAITSVPFSGTGNRISGNVAEGIYRVQATVPQGSVPGTYRWSLQMTSGGTSSSLVSYGWEALSPLPDGAAKTFSIQNTNPVNTYAIWAESLSLTGPGSNPEDDFDQDGLTNLTEFALGMDPKQPSRALLATTGSNITRPGLPRITLVGSDNQKRLQVSYIRRTGDASLAYTVQFSSDLVNWTAATQTPTSVATSDTLQALVVEDTPFNPAKSRRYARLRIAR